ncbi:MAG: magnesium transporter [Chloroflexi bacterium RBG_13_68_17]|nr:MAG: magnesium transporter [Chloroflexi bacterium RBG_13_68_17]
MEQTLIDSTLKSIQAALERGDLEAALACLLRLRPEDRADAFADLDDDDQAALLPRFGVPDAADLLEDLDDDQAADAAEALPIGQLADVLDEMEPDEAADVLGDLPPERAAQALAEMEDAAEVLPLLGHADETAGGLMTTSYFALRRHTTAAQAIEFLRQLDPDARTPYYLYVVDRDKHLVGVVGLRNLVVADPQAAVETFLDRDVIRVTAGTDQEEVARIMSRYDLAALPVVDDQGHLQGVITQDNVLDVMEEETTEDVLRLGGVEPGPVIDKPYWSQRVFEVARSRFVWLLGLFVAETLTGTVLRHFSDELEAVVSLSFFIPLLIGTGGNAGSQTVTTVIRALALDEVRRRDVVRVLVRELQTGILLGSLLGAVAFGRVLLWGLPTSMAVVVAVTILAICIWANTVGCLVPILADAVGIDPTVMSAPLITTLVDATGLLIYLRVAALVLSEI